MYLFKRDGNMWPGFIAFYVIASFFKWNPRQINAALLCNCCNKRKNNERLTVILNVIDVSIAIKIIIKVIIITRNIYERKRIIFIYNREIISTSLKSISVSRPYVPFARLSSAYAHMHWMYTYAIVISIRLEKWSFFWSPVTSIARDRYISKRKIFRHHTYCLWIYDEDAFSSCSSYYAL